MEEENNRLKEVLRHKNVQIANFEKQVKEITRVMNDWNNAYNEQVNMNAYLKETHREEILNLKTTLNLRVAERDAFKEALKIVTRKVKNNG